MLKLNTPACCASAIFSMSKVYTPVALPTATYIASAPTSDTTEPMNKNSVNFIAAYSRVLIQPQMAMSRYIGNTAIS